MSITVLSSTFRCPPGVPQGVSVVLALAFRFVPSETAQGTRGWSTKDRQRAADPFLWPCAGWASGLGWRALASKKGHPDRVKPKRRQALLQWPLEGVRDRPPDGGKYLFDPSEVLMEPEEGAVGVEFQE